MQFMNSSHNSLQVPSLKCCSNLKLVDDVFSFWVPILGLSLKSPCFWPLFWSYNPCFIPNFSIVATWVKLGTIWLKLGTVRKICRIFTLTRRGLMKHMNSSEGTKTWFDPLFFFLCTVFIQKFFFQGPVPPVGVL
jgi:hypothetical protein